MNFKAEQEKFDVIKWYDSIVAGEDRCGSYDFCGCCNKAETEPCARAAQRAAGETPSFPQEEEQKTLHPIVTIRLRVKKK